MRSVHFLASIRDRLNIEAQSRRARKQRQARQTRRWSAESLERREMLNGTSEFVAPASPSAALNLVADTTISSIVLQIDPKNGDFEAIFNGQAVGEWAPGGLSSIYLTSQAGSATIDISQTPAGVPLNVTADGDDTVNLGTGGSVQGIQGDVTLINPPAYNSLVIDDSADTHARQVSLSDFTPAGDTIYGSITGLAPASINYRLYDTTTVTVDGGSGGNTFDVNGGNSLYETYLNTGSGNDTVNVTATNAISLGGGGGLRIDGQAGHDNVTIGDSTLSAIAGAVDVVNTSGSTALTVADYGDSTGHTVALGDGQLTGLAPAAIDWTPTATGSDGVTSLKISGGSGGNTWNIANTSDFGAGATTLQSGNAGSYNYVNVAATTGALNLDGWSGYQSVAIGDANGTVSGIRGAIDVYNSDPTGYSVLYVRDEGDTTGTSATLGDGSLTGLTPAAITWTDDVSSTNFYGGVAWLNVYGGSGGNTWNVTNVGPLYAGTGLNSGSGLGATDTVNVAATNGMLVLNGQADRQQVTIGNQAAATSKGTLANIKGIVDVYNSNSSGATTLTIDDSGETVAKNVSLQDGALTGLSPAGIYWYDNTSGAAGGVNQLNIDGGSGGDTFNVGGVGQLYYGTTLTTGSGADAVNVTGSSGNLTIGNAGGSDTVTIGSAAPALGGATAPIQGAVQVGGAGSTALVVDDSGDSNPPTASIYDGAVYGLNSGGIFYTPSATKTGGVTSLAIDAGQNSLLDVLNDSALYAGTAINLASGYNTVEVADTKGSLNVANSGSYAYVYVGGINTSVGAGLLAGIQGAVNVSGAGSSVLYADDGADATGRTWNLAAGSITGEAPAPITWAGTGVSFVLPIGGGGGNTFNVASTSNLADGTEIDTGHGQRYRHRRRHDRPLRREHRRSRHVDRR